MGYKYIEQKERTYAKAYKVYSGAFTSSINIAQKYPNIDYTKLTVEDFVAGYESDSAINLDDQSAYYYPYQCWIKVKELTIRKSYNPNTGVLTLSKNNDYCDEHQMPGGYGLHYWSGLRIDVYMIVDGVKEEYK